MLNYLAYIHTCTYMCMYMYTHAYLYVYTHMYVFICIYVSICIYIYLERETDMKTDRQNIHIYSVAIATPIIVIRFRDVPWLVVKNKE